MKIITSCPDNLAAVKGIGKVYERRLNEAGYFTWSQVAKLTPAELQSMTGATDMVNVESWPAQAQNLAQQNQRKDVDYQGPVPDKLTEIEGLGESIQQRLYQSGIYTFEQLANTTVEHLEDIVPIAKRSIDANFQKWINQAKQNSQTN